MNAQSKNNVLALLNVWITNPLKNLKRRDGAYNWFSKNIK